MNPVDHPHGGGEGRTSGGRHPVTPWGKGTKGTKTRSRKKNNKMIVKKPSRFEQNEVSKKEKVMARAVWKGPFVDGYMLKKADIARASGRNQIIKTWSRRSTILPQFVGLTFGVYNGKKFHPGVGQ